ncbi:MAG: ABC transporter permease [Deltaproteobacteria bacterium]|nr:ABC transporter permease [Deltaproteobacteria bacterium]
MSKVIAIIVKELKTIARDPVGLVMLFILPAFFIVTLSVALQGAFSSGNSGERLDVLVVNEDEGEIGSRVVEALEKTDVLRIVEKIGGEKVTRKVAIREINLGRYRLAIVIPNKASDAVTFDENRNIEVLVEPVLSTEFAFTIKSAVQNIAFVSIVSGLLERNHITEEVYKDKLRQITSRLRLKEDKQSSDVDEFDDDYFTQSTNYVARRGLRVEQTYVSSGEARATPNAVQQSVPGWTIFALFWIAQLLAINIVGERMTGAYKRILVSPTTRTQYIVGKTIPYLVVNLIQAVFMFGIGVFVLPLLGCLEIELGNLPALAFMTVAISFVASGFGILMASVSKSDSFVATISAALLIIMCVIGGIMVPKFIMPEFMQKMSLYVPQGWAMDGYQNIIVKGHGVVDVLPCVGVLVLFGLGFFAVGLVIMKRIEKTA